jgi:hypothetical protein
MDPLAGSATVWAVPRNAATSWSTVASGLADRSTASAPDTTAVDADVPVHAAYPFPDTDVSTALPGASSIAFGHRSL